MTAAALATAKRMFENAYVEYNSDLKKYSYYKVHNHALAEDIVQDTYIRTWNYLLQGRQINMMKAFLYHVLNNLIVDEYRKKHTSSLDVLVEKGFEPKSENVDQTIDCLDAKTIVPLIQKLPKTYQRVIEMRFLKELSPAEISDITGQSKNTIAVQINRGIKKLKALYEHTGQNCPSVAA